MSKIYLSSTYTDLKEAREAVYHALRRLGHDVISMEDYVATDARPLDKCLADVQASDLYVGLFAWRYGYMPPNQSSSITELEFREAVKSKKSCLLFLLHEEAPWPRIYVDRDTQAIDTLRTEMSRDYTVSFFRTADELAALVSAAVTNLVRGQGSIPSPGSLQIADIVISRRRSPHPLLDIKLFNPGNTVVFLTEIAAVVLERVPMLGIVQPSAEYDLLIDKNMNALKVSHEILPNRAERILVTLGATKQNLACKFSLALEFTYNQGQVLKSLPFEVEFVEESSLSADKEPVRPSGLKPLKVESGEPIHLSGLKPVKESVPDTPRVQPTSLYVWSEIDADIYVDGSKVMTVDHRSGFDYSNAIVLIKTSSSMTVKARGLERTIDLWDFYVPGSTDCKVRIGTQSSNNIQISEEEKRKAMGNPSDLPALFEELSSGPKYPVRAWAAERLGYIGGEETIRVLVKAMYEDPEPYVQALAAYALGRIGEPSVIPEIEKAHKAYSSEGHHGYMFDAACRSLRSIEKAKDAKVDND